MKDANSIHNLLLVGFYDDNDKAEMLRKAFQENLFSQLEDINQLTVNGKEVEVEWFATGDMNFLCALYGHIGPASSFPCLLCEATTTEYMTRQQADLRTLESMTFSATHFASANASASQKTKLNKECKSCTMEPALKIPVTNIIPSSLHVIQGLGQDLIKLLEKEAKVLSTADNDLCKKLDNVYEKLGASKKPWFQQFTGNHFRLLLTGDGPARITAVVKASKHFDAFHKLLTLLGQLQGYAKASFLEQADIDEFGVLANNYFNAFRTAFPTQSITSKHHWLVTHVPQFMQRWKFWGLMSEQPIEAMHHQLNKDEKRLCSMKKRSLIVPKMMRLCWLKNTLFDQQLSSNIIPDDFELSNSILDDLPITV